LDVEDDKYLTNWSNKELEQLKAHYPDVVKRELIRLFPNRTYQSIQRMASYLGIKRTIPLRHSFESRAKMSIAHFGHKLSADHKMSLRRCSLNESVFDKLTESSAYWIGFLIADGNISYKKGIPIIALHLKEMDLQHLEKFRTFLGSTHKIGSYVSKVRGNRSYSISFSSERIADTLIKYGCVPKKCFVAEIKGSVQNNRHLWRGVIDGDGSLGVYNRKNRNGTIRRVPHISLTGTMNICTQFRDFLKREVGIMSKKIVRSRNSYQFMVSDHSALKAIKLLYNDCTIALDRKLIKANRFIENFGKDTQDSTK
jgi:hypothetical protein